ncbi:CTP synthase [compost metagenome]
MAAISYARRNKVPHLGTCAGFQHTILEYARNVLDIPEAQHEEYNPDADMLFITRLACSLAGQDLEILLEEETLAYSCYGEKQATESYYCNFGINPQFREKLTHSGLRLSGKDRDGEVRIVELAGHPFFAATLFVPQTRSTREKPHPLILRFVQACSEQ